MNDQLFEQIKSVVEAAMWSARSYGHEDDGVDGFEDEWDYEVNHHAEQIMLAMGPR